MKISPTRRKYRRKRSERNRFFSVRNELRFETKKSEIMERNEFSKGFVDPRNTYHDDQTRENDFHLATSLRIYFETYEQALRNS
jgi:hypothetical protein